MYILKCFLLLEVGQNALKSRTAVSESHVLHFMEDVMLSIILCPTKGFNFIC